MAITPIIRYFVFVSILLLLTTLIYIIFFNRAYSFLKKVIKNYFILCLLLIFLNFYWIIPSIASFSSKVIAPSYVLSYETTYMFSSSYKPADILTLKASWWPYLQLKPFPFIPESIFNIILFSIPILAMVSILLFNRYNREEKFLVVVGGLILLLGVFLWRGIANFNPIFSRFYEFLLFSTHPSIGWMFRVPGYFGSLVVLGYSLCILSLLSWIFRMRKFNKIGIILCIIIILSSLIIGWQRFTGDLDGILRKGYYLEDREHYDRAPYNKSIVLLSNYQGNFKAHHTGKPYINLPNDLSKYLENSLKRGDEKTVYYISYLSGADALITNLEIVDPKIYYIYPESKEGINIYLPDREIKNVYIQNKVAISKDFDYKLFSSLSLLNNSLSVVTEASETAELEINPDFYSNIFSKNSFFIKTFDATYHHNPSKLWTRASTSDPLHGSWHPYLERFNIENWQSDYGKGLVFTWAPNKLANKVNPTEKDLINFWSFESERDVEEWKNYTKENQFNAIHKVIWDENEKAMRVELWNSTWGWKTINSPLIPVKYGEKYNIAFDIMAQNGESVHCKVVELDSKKKSIGSYYISSIGSGNFSWKRIDFYYEPKNVSSSYIQLQIWHGHQTNKSLPNIIWVKNSSFSTYKRLLLDNIFIYSVDNSTSEERLEDLFASEETPAEVLNYSKINPTLWKVQVNASKPFMLSFAESYDPLWEARVYKDGKLVEKVKSLPLYGVINGFWINTTGENLEIVIRYTPQDWFEMGLVISGITFAFCIFYLIYDWRKGKGDIWTKRLERSINEKMRNLKLLRSK
ncbi:MAG: hypothetical protein QXJ28_01305 [Candidatus Pacearchaeota archaeon]